MQRWHSFWQRWRLQRVAIDTAAWQTLCNDHALLRRLPLNLQTQLHVKASAILARKSILAADHYVINDAQRLTIAALAALPIVQLPLSFYDPFYSFIVYPDEFLIPREEEDEYGIVHSGLDVVSGEAWQQGPVIVSWADIAASFDDPTYNVVVHECVHQLDLSDGEINGVPSLRHTTISAKEWQTTMQHAWQHFCEHCDDADFAFDDYGSDSPEEFFAVCSEYFFGDPARLQQHYTDVYALLSRFYQLSPLQWTVST